MERVDDINEQAAAWVVRLNSDQATRSEREAFREWLEADEAHAMAYAEHSALFAGLRHLSDDDEARDILLPRADRMAGPRLSRRGLIAAGAALAAGMAGLVLAPMFAEQTVETEPGEQKHIRLADGSDLVVNTASKVRVHLSDHERRIVLDRGQVFFQVAKDRARPFRVFVGTDEVRALGTAFDVRRIDDTARVTLEEGKVAIYRHAVPQEVAPLTSSAAAKSDLAMRPSAVLTPGQQAIVSGKAAVSVQSVNLEAVQAWRYGRLILDDTPLGDTVADLNRYGGPQIVLDDPSLAGIKVSGVFHTGDPATFVNSIVAAFPVKVTYQDDQKIVLTRKAS